MKPLAANEPEMLQPSVLPQHLESVAVRVFLVATVLGGLAVALVALIFPQAGGIAEFLGGLLSDREFLLFAAVLVGLVGNWLLYLRGRRVLSSLYRSVQERAEQQELLATLFDRAAHGILLYDEMGVVCSANPAACRIFGYSHEDLLGRSIAAVLPELLSPESAVGTNQVRVLGTEHAFRARSRQGLRFPVSVGLGKVRVNGQVVFTAIVQDLRELHQARDDAEAASRAKTVFLQHMSHELRTPLNGILGMAQVMHQGELSEQQQSQLATLERSAELLLGMVEEVLELTRLDRGEVALAVRPFGLRQVMKKVLWTLQASAQLAGLRLQLNVGENVPDRLCGDPQRLGQVLHYLGENAIKSTPQGEVEIAVRLGTGQDTTGEFTPIVFEVRSTGPALNLPQPKRILQATENSEKSEVGSQRGLGVGLSLVARLVALMNGSITAESQPKHGSMFRVELPLRQGSQSPRPTHSEPTRLPLLVVVGDGEKRAELERTLESRGWVLVAVENGRAALAEFLGAIVQGDPFGAVLVAEQLEDMPGSALLARLQDIQEWRCPTFLLTEAILPGGGPGWAGRLECALRQAASASAE